MKPFSNVNRKQEIILIFCFLISGYSLFGQNFQISSDRSVIQVFLKEKPQLPQLAVYTGEEIPSLKEGMPSMMGNFYYEKDSLYFTPTFSFQPNRSYHLFEGQKHLLSFRIPDKNPSPKTRLTHIYPSAETVPANLLKMYLYFSAPMREGFSYQHIHVTDSKGDTLIRPFLTLTPELWDMHSQRLTLWFDPGRLKRDLIPNKDLGTPLEAGENYTLYISANWKDLSGKKIASEVTHSFYVQEADRKKPGTDNWSLIEPKPNSKEPLSIDFKESLDQALAMATITVWKDEHLLEGEVQLSEKESIWTFIPNQNWETGTYKIWVEARLEDLAGNNLNRLFDRDMLKEKNVLAEKEMFKLEFKVDN